MILILIVYYGPIFVSLGFSGADLAALVREAGLAVVKEWRDLGRFHTMTLEDPQFSAESAQVCQRHFEAAFGKVKPSVAQEDRMRLVE